jgi:hypothetical protein
MLFLSAFSLYKSPPPQIISARAELMTVYKVTTHRVLVVKPEGKRPLGRPRSRWEDNIKIDLQEVGGGCGDWMELAQDKDRWRSLVSTVRNLRVPKVRGIS